MIRKLNKVKNIGSFQLFDWDTINPPQIPDKNGNLRPNETSFRKYNISYGENSTGKSTIVEIFKALNINNDEGLKKNWDREGEDRSIELLTDGPTISFTESNLWQNNNLEGKFIFFDKYFVEKYIQSFPSGRTVDHDKSTGELILYLGDFSSYKKQLDNLDYLCEQLTEENDELKGKNDLRMSVLINEYSSEEMVNEFDSIKLKVRANLTTNIRKVRKEIKAHQDEISKLGKVLDRTEDIENLESLLDKDAEEVPDVKGIEEALDFSVSSGTIDVFKKIKDKEGFVQQGLEVMKKSGSDICPFCEQVLKDKSGYLHIIQEYDKVFDSKFLAAQSDVKEKLENYKALLMDVLRLRQPEENDERLAKINKLLELSNSVPQLSLKREDITLLKKEIKIVDKKLNEILKKTQSGGVKKVLKIINRINKNIEKYNRYIKKVNGVVGKTKKELKTGKLVEREGDLSSNLEKLILRNFVLDNWKILKENSTSHRLYENNKSTIEKLKIIQQNAIGEVRAKFKEFSDKYFSYIELYIEKFCPSLEMKIQSSRSTYDLRVGDVLCGFEVQYKDRDRLTELSEGEKQAIAIAFFLALLAETHQKDKKIVVFDDPITSFDAGKRKMCAEYILREVIPFQQTFIFTCDPLFRVYCLKSIGRKFGEERSFYYILKSASSSIHHRTDRQTTIYAIFKSEFQTINTALGTDENIITYGQKLRYCIEEVKDKYLGYSHDSLENVLTQVKSSNMDKLKVSIDDLLEIYSYCNTGGLAHYPRDGQTSWGELKIYINRYLKLAI